MTRLMPVFFIQHRYEHQGEEQIRYSEHGANPNFSGSMDFSKDRAVIGFGLRPTGKAITSTTDADEFRSDAGSLCVKTHWLSPVWRDL